MKKSMPKGGSKGKLTNSPFKDAIVKKGKG